MLAKDTLPFDRAFEEFNAAQKAHDDLLARHEDAHQQLLRVRMEVAANQREIEGFALQGKSDVGHATKILAKQTQTKQVEALLERAMQTIDDGLVAARADILIAERKCRDAQHAYHAKVRDDLIDNFLAESAEALVDIARHATLTQRFDPGVDVGVIPTSVHIPDVLELARRVAYTKFADVAVGEVPEPTAIAQPVKSDQLNGDERARGRLAIATGGRAGLIRELTPKVAAVAAAEPFDMQRAVQSAREAARSSEAARFEIEGLEEAARRNPNMKESIEQKISSLKAAMERHDASVQRWDDLISQNRKS